MISETRKAWDTLQLQRWSAEQEISTGSGPRKRAYASFSPGWQKALLSLKKADDGKTLFSLHKVTINHKILFSRSFHPQGCSGLYRLPLLYRRASVIFSAAGEKKKASSNER